jgi:lauroyl/myristoyl acyltransferase
MNAAFEKLIQHDPVQYMWLLKLFKSQVEQSETRY